MLDYCTTLVYNLLLLINDGGLCAYWGFKYLPISTISIVNVFSQALNVLKIYGGVIVYLWS